MTINCVSHRIQCNFYKEKDIFKANRCSHNGRIVKTVFINKYAVGRQKNMYPHYARDNAPKGFLSVTEWAAREGMSKSYPYYLIRNEKVSYIIEDGYYYIHEDTKWKKWKRKEKTVHDY